MVQLHVVQAVMDVYLRQVEEALLLQETVQEAAHVSNLHHLHVHVRDLLSPLHLLVVVQEQRQHVNTIRHNAIQTAIATEHTLHQHVLQAEAHLALAAWVEVLQVDALLVVHALLAVDVLVVDVDKPKLIQI